MLKWAGFFGLLLTLVLVIFGAAFFSPPAWISTVKAVAFAANVWYGPGFENDVGRALAALPASDAVCIYDDTQNAFVESIEQLDMELMIGRAVQDTIPRKRSRLATDPRWREPHFRVYSAGDTYLWSFKRRQFFEASGWSLDWSIRRKCESNIDDQSAPKAWEACCPSTPVN